MALPEENSEQDHRGVQCSEGPDDFCQLHVACTRDVYYEIIPLIKGYSLNDGPGQQRATGSSTLVKGRNGRKNVVVDTGNPSEKDKLLRALQDAGMNPHEIDFVIGTHGHSDHVGNLNAFPDATFIVSYDMSKGDSYWVYPFDKGVTYKIEEGLEVIPTPGHTNHDVSVVVENTMYGVVAITGDLFEKKEDLELDDLWKQFSENPSLQKESREKILMKADYIVPGHGTMFKNTKKVNHN